MSFCQKHHNHHCIHSHNCKDPTHKQSKPRNKRISTTGFKQLHRIPEQNQSCEFDGIKEPINSVEVLHLQKIIMNLKQQVENLKRQGLGWENKCHNLASSNSHYQAQLQYYRNQMQKLVKSNAEDIKNEIKRHLKENSQLTVRNRCLNNQLVDKEKQLSQLNQEKLTLEKKIGRLGRQNQDLQKQLNKIIQRAKGQLSQQQKQQTDKISKEKGKVQEKYQIIFKEAQINTKKHQRQLQKSNQQNRQLEQQILILKKKLNEESKLSHLQAKKLKERENMMMEKIQSLEEKLKHEIDKSYQLTTDLKQKEQELKYAKKALEKHLMYEKENQQLNQHLTQIGNHSKPEDRMEENSENVENQEYKIKILTEENRKLKKQIGQLSKGGPKNEQIQEYILNVGASQAFKRIIEQKNAYIKELIKAKGELLQRLG